MFLKDIQLLPGKIIEIVDEKGTIKATSVGLFSVDDDPELLPPIYPFIENPISNFSSPLVDDEIWIIYNNSNTQVLYYIKRRQIPQHLQDLMNSGDENIEVIMSRDTDDGLYQIFFSDGTGLKLLKDESSICIKNDDTIVLATPDASRTISIGPSSISLGTEGSSAEPALLGDQTKTALTQIYNLFMSIASAAAPGPFTAPIATAINATVAQLQAQIEKVQSENVTLD